MKYTQNMSQYELLSSISHEIRTPIHSILGMAELAMEENDVASVKDYLQKIKDVSRTLTDSINELLGSIGLEQQEIKLGSEKCTMLDIYEMVVMQAKYYLDGRNISFSMNLDKMIKSEFLTDKRRLEELLTNLISNAVKYTEDGGSITFEAVSVRGKKGHVLNRYTLTDTGIGMSAEYCNGQIFEPFSREVNAITMKREGKGLGMYVVKHLVDLMDGTITIESKQGEGTTVVVEVSNPICNMLDKKPKQLSKNLDVNILKGKRILLCEDNSYNAEMTKQFMENAGMFVDCVANGMEAVKQIANTPEYYYDAVLMDIRMPVMDGSEATIQIRGLGRDDTYELPIAALTASADDEDYQKALAAGMDTYLVKPFSVKTLLQKMTHFWDVYKASVKTEASDSANAES